MTFTCFCSQIDTNHSQNISFLHPRLLVINDTLIKNVFLLTILDYTDPMVVTCGCLHPNQGFVSISPFVADSC